MCIVARTYGQSETAPKLVAMRAFYVSVQFVAGEISMASFKLKFNII